LMVMTVPGAHDLEVVEAIGYDAEELRPIFRVPLYAHLPITDAVRLQQPVWIQSRQDWDAYSSGDIVPFMREEAWACLPIGIGSDVIGAIAFGFPVLRRFNQTEQRFMTSLARLCGQALERARLYESAERARCEAEQAQHRLAMLANVSSVLAQTLDSDKTLA